MAGHGGGAWKVAYADFVTAMMAFFLVMWILSQSEKVKQAVAGYFREPFAYSDTASTDQSGAYGGRARRPKRGSSVSPTGHPDESQMHKAHGMALSRSELSGTGAMVFFDEDSANLSDDAKKRLSELAPLIAGKTLKIEVRGHTSRRPLPPGGSYHDAWQLSFARCEAVMKFLEQQGIPPDRIRLSQAAGNEPFSSRVEAEFRAQSPRRGVLARRSGAQRAAGELGTRAANRAAEGAIAPAWVARPEGRRAWRAIVVRGPSCTVVRRSPDRRTMRGVLGKPRHTRFLLSLSQGGREYFSAGDYPDNFAIGRKRLPTPAPSAGDCPDGLAMDRKRLPTPSTTGLRTATIAACRRECLRATDTRHR